MTTANPFRNRIVGSGTEDPQDLLANPYNWRIHTQAQRAVLAGTLDEIGWIQQIIVNRTTGHIVDGHLRASLAIERGEPAIPVIYVDLTEQEEKLVLAVLDPIAGLAGTDQDKLDDLIADLDAEDENLRAFLDELRSADDDGRVAEKHASLQEQFLVPPFSVLDGRQGYWIDRKRTWLGIGIKSELGRGSDGKKGEDGLTFSVSSQPGDVYDRKAMIEERDGRLYTWNEFAEAYPEELRLIGDSVFDPVICELAYRWFSPPGGIVLDPFAGGSVRGIVAALTGRSYVGIDLRAEQIEANRRNWDEVTAALRCRGAFATQTEPSQAPRWITGDSAALNEHARDTEADLVFSCPPYADLEVYSDDPRDISGKKYPEFLAAYREIIRHACEHLRKDRFAVWVVGDVRDRRGNYRNFVGDTVQAFIDAGLTLYNEAVYIQPNGSLAMRAGRLFRTSRKLGKGHQNLLVFAKGKPERLAIPDIAKSIAEQFEEHREMIEGHRKVLVFAKGDARRATEACGPVLIDEPEEAP